MKPEPTKEHHWLKQLLGEWTYEMEAEDPAGSSGAEITSGTEMVYPVGDLWIQIEGNTESPETGLSRSLLTLGYDLAKGKFVGTFVSSEMDYMWYYEGSLDESGTQLTLATEGPDFEDSTKRAPYEDIIEIIGPNQRLFRSRSKDAAGEWQEFMKMTLSRSL